MPRALRVVWIVFMLCAMWLTPAGGQERKGIVTGLITDPAHAILQGASVELQPTGKKAVSDNTGQFSITEPHTKAVSTSSTEGGRSAAMIRPGGRGQPSGVPRV